MFSEGQALKFYRLSYKVFSKKSTISEVKDEVKSMPDELLFHSIKVFSENIRSGSNELSYLSLCHVSRLIQADVTMFRADDLMDFMSVVADKYQYSVLADHVVDAFHIAKAYLVD